MHFLRTEAARAAALYILGDLFEYWVGDEEAETAFNRDILEGLAALAAAGVPVSLMHGNRDFLVGRRAARRARLALIDDPKMVELFGVPTLLMHGDTLCTEDVRYQEVRARWRRPLIIRAFLLLPLALRRRIGVRLREVSERTKRGTSVDIMDVSTTAVEQVLRRYGYPRLIHGHTHRPAHHVHEVDGRRCERWVLGDWYRAGSYLRVDAAGVTSVSLQDHPVGDGATSV